MSRDTLCIVCRYKREDILMFESGLVASKEELKAGCLVVHQSTVLVVRFGGRAAGGADC